MPGDTDQNSGIFCLRFSLCLSVCECAGELLSAPISDRAWGLCFLTFLVVNQHEMVIDLDIFSSIKVKN